jgi:hypothetical protein
MMKYIILKASMLFYNLDLVFCCLVDWLFVFWSICILEKKVAFWRPKTVNISDISVGKIREELILMLVIKNVDV